MLAGADASIVAVATISSDTLRLSDPESLQLLIPGAHQPLTARKRHDVDVRFPRAEAAVTTPVPSGITTATDASSSRAESAETLKPYAWVGELEGYPGALSTVALVVSELDGSTYGSIRFVDMEAKKVHSYAVSNPVTPE
jgi:hypothetical protein